MQLIEETFTVVLYLTNVFVKRYEPSNTADHVIVVILIYKEEQVNYVYFAIILQRF